MINLMHERCVTVKVRERIKLSFSGLKYLFIYIIHGKVGLPVFVFG